MEEFSLSSEYIELIKLLKLLQWVPSGGVAKLVVDDGLVKVNGEVELRKRRKLVKGDLVTFEDCSVSLV